MSAPFSLNTLLAILQQSEYELPRVEKWWQAHQHDTNLPQIEPEKWTTKLKFFRRVYFLTPFLPPLLRLKMGLALFTPLEFCVRQSIYTAAKMKLQLLRWKGLKVVAIAGSYGKTSTKHILAHTLGSSLKLCITPTSINTPLGISQVILKQLSASHQVFVVELGEYNLGDISRFCRLIRPQYGILTPVGRQHLERLESLEKIVEMMLELPAFLKYDTNKLLLSDVYQSYLKNHSLHFYGQSSTAQIRVSEPHVSRAGTEFTIVDDTQHQTFSAFSPLLGAHQAANVLPSYWLGRKLGVDPQALLARLATMPYITRRHEPTLAEHNVLILDNSYNTNPESVGESLKLLNQLDASNRIFITPGFVELGESADEIHFRFGKQLATQVDWLGLLEAPSNEAIIKGFLAGGQKRQHVVQGKTDQEVVAKLQPHITSGSVIIFEGGFQEIYG
jgi:UDP-N-acetylmuramoyl-tripeptide--D-alanyl-D-alanine ligase